jgi:peroxiredoxin
MAVEAGDTAPDFELASHVEKGKKVKLSDFRRMKNVFIAFFPLAWTPV